MRSRVRGWLVPPALCGSMLAAGCAPVAPPLNIHVGGDGRAEPCFVEMDGQRIDAESLATVARARHRRAVRITGPAQLPYRCLGAVIYALQRAGFTRIGFISEPAIGE